MIITCPNMTCKSELEIKKEMFGKIVQCPACKKTISLKSYKKGITRRARKEDPEILKRKLIAFFKAVLSNDTNNASTLLNFSPKLARTKDAKGRYPLHLACQKDYIEMMELLLSKNVDIDALDAEGNTPLMAAVRHNAEKSVEHLLAKGASLDFENKNHQQAIDIAREQKLDKLIAIIEGHN